MSQYRGDKGNYAEAREKTIGPGPAGGQHSSGSGRNKPERTAVAGRKNGKISRRKKAA